MQSGNRFFSVCSAAMDDNVQVHCIMQIDMQPIDVDLADHNSRQTGHVYSSARPNRDIIEQQISKHRPLKQGPLPPGCEVLQCPYGHSRASLVLEPLIHSQAQQPPAVRSTVVVHDCSQSAAAIQQPDTPLLPLLRSSQQVSAAVNRAAEVGESPSRQLEGKCETPQASSGQTQIRFTANAPDLASSPNQGDSRHMAEARQREGCYVKGHNHPSENSSGDDEGSAAAGLEQPLAESLTKTRADAPATGLAATSAAIGSQNWAWATEARGSQLSRDKASGAGGTQQPDEHEVICLLSDSDDDQAAAAVRADAPAITAAKHHTEETSAPAVKQDSGPSPTGVPEPAAVRPSCGQPKAPPAAADADLAPSCHKQPLGSGIPPGIYVPGTSNVAVHAPALREPGTVLEALSGRDFEQAKERYMAQLSAEDKRRLKEKKCARIIITPPVRSCTSTLTCAVPWRALLRRQATSGGILKMCCQRGPDTSQQRDQLEVQTCSRHSQSHKQWRVHCLPSQRRPRAQSPGQRTGPLAAQLRA